jgi:activated CDC42 kinase 1
MAGRRSTPGLFELLQEADLSHYYNELRNSLRVCHVQQLKYVNDDDLCSIGMSKVETQRLKNLHTKYCPPNYVSKLKKLLLPSWSKDEFLLDDEASETVPLPPSTTFNKSMPLLSSSSMEAMVHHQGVAIKVPRQHLISPESIQIYKELGTGEFGVVQQGVWIDTNQVTRQVAIKSLSKERMHNSTVKFMKEYEIMQTIDHQNIVRLFGVVLDSSQIMIITELAPLRSLLECLKEPNLRTTLTVPCLAGFAENICGGMKYLESRRLIHRDLAARNILVFSQHVVKISDFGLSRALGVGKDYYQTNFSMNLKLPIAWCAPECITFLKFTSASDVWAFGVTMWEMFSYGFQPWAAQTGQQILEAIDEPNHQRLEKPLYCPARQNTTMPCSNAGVMSQP